MCGHVSSMAKYRSPSRNTATALPGPGTVRASPSAISPTRATVTILGIFPPPRLTGRDRLCNSTCPIPSPPGNPPMLEVEVKCRLPDPAAVEARLRAWGAVVVADHAEADHYLNA